MTSDLLNALFESTLVLSLGLLAVLALRVAWRYLFGPRNALLLWLIVPTVLVAVLWPAPVQRIDAAAEAMIAHSPTMLPAARDAVVRTLPSLMAGPAASSDEIARPAGAARLVVWGWLFGAALMAMFLMVSQWRCVRALGSLTRMPDGTYRSAQRAAGPVLIGALRPKIVLPEAFERRYSQEQRVLILAHERCHLRRGDAQFTLLACILRCVFWFNPLVHLAWPHFRTDLELACDAVVLRKHPERRRLYAETLLASQLDSPRLPVGCTWRSGNPLKKRVRMMGTGPVGGLRMVVGTALIAAAGSVAAIGAWQQQDPQRFFVGTPMPRLQLDVVPTEPAAASPGLARLDPPSPLPIPQNAVSIRPPAQPESAVDAPDHVAVDASTASVPAAPNRVGESEDAPSAGPVVVEGVASTAPVLPVEELVDVQHARLVEAQRPAVPESRYQPRLIRYPGMPASERPAADWQPEGNLWVLLMRVRLDENGQPVDVEVEDTNLVDGRSVDRYERLMKDAVRRWTFAPARIDDRPVASDVLLPFYFDTRMNARPIEFDRGSYQPMGRSMISKYVDR